MICFLPVLTANPASLGVIIVIGILLIAEYRLLVNLIKRQRKKGIDPGCTQNDQVNFWKLAI